MVAVQAEVAQDAVEAGPKVLVWERLLQEADKLEEAHLVASGRCHLSDCSVHSAIIRGVT